MRKALATGICLVALGCATSKPLVRAVPCGGYSVDRTGLSYAFGEGDPDFRVVEGYAVLRSDLELLGSIIGLENGTVVPVKEGDDLRLVGSIEYQHGSANTTLRKADKNKDFAVNTDELNQLLYSVLKKLYPGLVQ